MIKEKCKEILDEDRFMKLAQNRQALNIRNEITILQKNVIDINNRIDKLFEDKYKGVFDENDFSRLYFKLKNDRALAEERIEQLKKKEEKQESTDEIKQVLRNFLETEEITKPELVSLVNKIEISEDKKITIQYKYSLLNQNIKDSLEDAG